MRQAPGSRMRAIAVSRKRPSLAPAPIALLLLGLFLMMNHARAAVDPCATPAAPASAATSSAATPLAVASSAPAAKCAHPVKTITKTKAVPPPAVISDATPATGWRTVLDPLDAGGWKQIADGPPENPSVLYASSHNILHNGNVVTVWMRWEFSHPQADVYPLHYLSAVTREELDCDGRSYRRAAVIYYIRNNLLEKGPSFTALNDDTTWKLAIPGSEPDAMLTWGCPAATALPHKAHAKADSDDEAAADKAKAGKSSSAPDAPSSAPAAAAGGIDLHTAK